MINLKSNTQTLVAIWSRTLGSTADTFVIFLELSILINVWSIGSRTQKHSLLFEVGLRGLYSWHVCKIFPKAEFVRIFTECSEVWIEHTIWQSWSDTYSFDTSANFALWQIRHRFNPRKRVNDYQPYSMLTVLPLRSMSCTLGNSYSL